MAIIYTYPVKTNPAGDDLILISDSADSKKTKQVKVSALPSSGGGSVSSVGFSLNSLNAFTLTGDNPVTGSGTITLGTTGGSAGQYLDYQGNWSTPSGGGGGTPSSPTNSVQFNNAGAFGGSANLTFSTDTLTIKDNVIIQGDGSSDAGKLKLNCYDNSHHIELIGPDHGGGASSYSVKFPATGPGGSQKILQSDASGVLSWINTPSSGGGGSVDSVNTTDGTFVNLTPNSATTGAVTVTADLSATGTAGNTTFLRGDNQWAVPVGTTYSAGTGLSLNTNTFSLATGAALTNLGGGTGSTFLKKDGTWATPTITNTNIGGTNLTLTNNRTLNFYSDTSDKSLTFIGGDVSGTKTLFKFDTVTNKPRLTIGDTTSTYEGTLDIKGNGSNRTGKINLYNAAGTYSINIQAPTTFGANLNIPYVLPNTQGAASTFLQNNGSGTLTWAVPTNSTDIILTTTGTSGASTWDGTTLNIPQYSGGGSSANLGFTPLSTYEADDLTVASYTYYALLVCDVDITVSNAKVFVRSGTSAIYAALYSTTSGNMQTSSFTRLGTFSKTTGVATGINILAVDGTVTLTAGQTIMLGFSSANQMAGGAAINSNAMGVEATSLTTSFPASIADIENTTSASKRVAIHFYAG